ncbi:ATP-binding protein [Thiobacillus denitrificans]|uniref:ATP-binding protein n=1 Tax=Thiobacillus denitrificans TaxID=36861 RepID=UPI00037CB28E|nr:ATP-binding protein [Thiobacillus denitrificans]
MSSHDDNQWIETNRRALNGELAWLQQLLENALDRDTAIAVEKPADTSRVLDFLSEQFQLSAFERTLLLLCAGMELEANIAQLCGANQDDTHVGHLTFGLALAVLPEAHWSACSPQAPLRYWHLINFGNSPRLTTARLSIDERILHYLLGVPAQDARLDGLLRDLPQVLLPPSQRQQAEHLLHAWRDAQGRLPLLGLYGQDPSGIRAVAEHVCGTLALHPLCLRANDIPSGAGERALLAQLLTRECLLMRGALTIETDDQCGTQLAPLLDQLDCPVILLGKPSATMQQRCILMEIRKPLAVEQRDLWRGVLADVEGIDDTVLLPITAHFDFSAEDIAAAAEETRSEMKNGALPQILWQICRRRARGELERLAQRITPRATWNDLILPAPQRAILNDTVRQVRHRTTVYEQWGFAGKSERGLGISALFAGESGTGKTLAAEVLAGELGLDLYRIDLSAVVSKYIGETEKNLEQLFAAAETSGAVLLFDEADALFGKRSEVKDSHDRYANIELAYLLQRMESYRGLSILTTNLKSSLDAAFLRRIRFVVQFPFPDVSQRTEIWRRIFPEALPHDELKLDQLARLHVSGGNIRNIAMNAAFFAAEDGTPLSMAHLARAARTEYSKLEKPINEAEIGGWR